MRSPVEILADIRLNMSCVEQFCDIARSLADDNPEIEGGVFEATKEACAAARLIDHLRSLFSHQHSIEEQASAATSLAEVPYLKLAQFRTDAGSGPMGALSSAEYGQHNPLQLSAQNSLLFRQTNQLNLYRASKSLLANIAKILYLTDSVLLPAELKRPPASLHDELNELATSDRSKVSR